MVKPKRLKKGDKVALVSLSWGGIGDPALFHKYKIAQKRLKEEFGLTLVPMKNALKGSEFIKNHPKERAEDLMEAFLDPQIDAVFCAIGGDDTIRLLPYIDYEVIRTHPKIFMGYSDTTINHFMMQKAGLVSFYGPSVMCEFGEYGKMFSYTVDAVRKLLFADSAGYAIPSSPVWSDDQVEWKEENQAVCKQRKKEERGYELLQGAGIVKGHLLGGCLDVFMMTTGTTVWPNLEDWENAMLFLETSEDEPAPDYVIWAMRNLAAQGILKVITAILVGKPHRGTYYEEYKKAILQVVKEEEGLDIPILYNMNFGHAMPIGIIPYGIEAELDCERRTVRLLESATVESESVEALCHE